MTSLVRSIAPLLPTRRLLTEGGDERIALDQLTMTNKYGCRSVPDNQLAAFGSATASTISEAGFAAADEMRKKLLSGSQIGGQAENYWRELRRIRAEIISLCGLDDLSGLEVIFSPSGTDAHMLAARLVAAGGAAKMLVIMVQPTETGRGVRDALAGRMHFRYASASSGSDVGLLDYVEVATVAIRTQDGCARPAVVVDDEVEAIVSSAVTSYDRILIVTTDVSKTGILAPTPGAVLSLRSRWPDRVEILIDAAQFRLAASSLRAYLMNDCMVAVTGSKFVGGPIFSAALLVPGAAASRLARSPLDPALRMTCARAEWPRNWNGAEALPDVCNYGLLLRWEAALAELRLFRAIPDADVESVVRAFGDMITRQLAEAAHFEPLEQPMIDRRAIVSTKHWDQIPTIFPFLLLRMSAGRRRPLAPDETKEVYDRMRHSLGREIATSREDDVGRATALRCELGQPVLCGERHGVQLTALRLCLSARLIVEAVGEGRRGLEDILNRALHVLDKVAYLVDAKRVSS
jgi:hypothetical protein